MTFDVMRLSALVVRADTIKMLPAYSSTAERVSQKQLPAWLGVLLASAAKGDQEC
jgi:hypothetical protein